MVTAFLQALVDSSNTRSDRSMPFINCDVFIIIFSSGRYKLEYHIIYHYHTNLTSVLDQDLNPWVLKYILIL